MKDRAIMISIYVEIVNQNNLPFLFGGVSLDKAGAVLRLGEVPTFQFEDYVIPLYRSKSGHFHLQVMTLSKQDERNITRGIVNDRKWTKAETVMLTNITDR